MSTHAARIEKVLHSAGVAPSAASRALLPVFLRELARWNAKLDLTAARDDDELVDLFLADAAQLAARLPRAARVVDVGAGAGAPGLVLAILREDLRCTLIEPLAKRTSFLRSFCAQHLADWPAPPRVVRGRIEALPEEAAQHDVAISRATFEPSEWLRCARTLLAPAPSSSCWLLHAQHDAPEAAGLLRAASERYLWANTGFSRQLTRYNWHSMPD